MKFAKNLWESINSVSYGTLYGFSLLVREESGNDSQTLARVFTCLAATE